MVNGLRRRAVTIQVEQAVYGSFPFWDRGYALLAQSEGCGSARLDAFCAACMRYGQRPHAVEAADGLFAMRIAGGGWVIVGVGEGGKDDRGRPGAMSFHGVFVTSRDYRRIGSAPFGFEPFLRRVWEPQTGPLPGLSLTLQPFRGGGQDAELAREEASHATLHLAKAIVGALRCRRRVALETEAPIEGLARRVWSGLPRRVRGRCSVATWAYGNENRFDVVALPRLDEAMVDRLYVDRAALMRPEGWPTPPQRVGRMGGRLLAALWKFLARLARWARNRMSSSR